MKIGQYVYRIEGCNTLYTSTDSLDSNNNGYLIANEYLTSKEFYADSLDLFINKFSSQFRNYMLEHNEFSLDLNHINELIEVIGDEYFTSLKECSRRFVQSDILEKFIDSGVFELTGPYTPIIQIRKL